MLEALSDHNQQWLLFGLVMYFNINELAQTVALVDCVRDNTGAQHSTTR